MKLKLSVEFKNRILAKINLLIFIEILEFLINN